VSGITPCLSSSASLKSSTLSDARLGEFNVIEGWRANIKEIKNESKAHNN